ncbi:hypothetical protein COOONC_27531 [Cooperia oncophora]
MHLDDGLIWGCSREECERVSKDIRKDLKSFGWFEAQGKCNWLPAAETKAILKRTHESSILTYQDEMNGQVGFNEYSNFKFEQEAIQSFDSIGGRGTRQIKEGDILLDRQPNNGIISIAVPASKATRTQFYHRVDASAHSVGAVLKQRGDIKALTTFPETLVTDSSTSTSQKHREPAETSRRHLRAAEPFRAGGSQGRMDPKRADADDKNTICQRFLSKSWCPRTSGIDAFLATAAWSGHFLWLVPPPNLVSRTLSWARHFGSFGILGCPYWPSQAYFLILKPEEELGKFRERRSLFPGSKIFTPCPHSNIFNSEFSRIRFMFLLIDFRESPFPQRALTF